MPEMFPVYELSHGLRNLLLSISVNYTTHIRMMSYLHFRDKINSSIEVMSDIFPVHHLTVVNPSR